jgi:hypothetical protein
MHLELSQTWEGSRYYILRVYRQIELYLGCGLYYKYVSSLYLGCGPPLPWIQDLSQNWGRGAVEMVSIQISPSSSGGRGGGALLKRMSEKN